MQMWLPVAPIVTNKEQRATIIQSITNWDPKNK